ncbi:MAG: NAD-dependent epimerase/dehydratase family protein [Actinobacteria bacterium]|uniref:UDP-glucuronate decarboxylase n=1 Tax=freshwater metagenome TaxID=449393 RepID=A0A6J7CG37_9ZZZZ|nr:NAD-dependent epimerase/dehydratase family protein [Actinomycetota bacterium]MSX24281.1 NAD-dependent epimerase/dehydratase family protein [Actinomycetota bacterium]MSY46158.1 NAD-dependent epimerase/dehydratase family protein [Actinomycetota bacterium]MSY56660.1 NAD-dependent epimerase/dehydratase family protein [Actinomycetota bacterium]MTB00415.1 NAD-dependent epimerase/dehydratase family protein [Actinomycetota bacterium]
MRVLVTGGAGFIGSHLCDRLIADGHQVCVLDNLETGQLSNLEGAQASGQLAFINGSVLDAPLVERLVSENDFTYHLAAAVGVFNILDKPLASLMTNIRGTENVLDASLKHSRPVLIASSSEVYGKNISDSLQEDDSRILGSPLMLRWSYSQAKAIDETLAFAFYQDANLQVRIVRFFNTVGPRQLGAYGMVVPRFVEAALANKDIQIYGDGNQTRCFGHVADIIDALIAVTSTDKTIGTVVNIGNSEEISINDLASKIIAATGSASKVVHVSYEQAYKVGFEDMERRVPNIDRIKELTGWAPKRNLETIIKDVADYIKSK